MISPRNGWWPNRLRTVFRSPLPLSLLHVAALTIGIGSFDSVTGYAEPLAKEACDQVAVEHEKLIVLGVKDWMAHGAKGALARLGIDKLAQVERYIVLEEQLLYRCGLFRARTVLAPDVEETPSDAAQASPTAKTGEKGTPSPAASTKSPASKRPANAVPPVDERKPKPVAADSAANSKSSPSAGANTAKPEPQRPPAKKPRADDAYRPPSKD